MKTQAIVTTIVAVVVIFIVSFIVSGSMSSDNQTSAQVGQSDEPAQTSSQVDTDENGITLYYSPSCPACVQLEEWMQVNDIEEVLEISHKEVFSDQANARQMMERASSCGLDVSTIGVPFMYSQGQCLMGYGEIAQYLGELHAQNR